MLVVLLSGMVAAATYGVGNASGGSEWVDLFEGDSLSLWEKGSGAGGSQSKEIGDLWSLNDGVLSLDREKEGRGGFIVTKKSYYDLKSNSSF